MIGLTVMILGVAGISVSTGLEIRKREPLYGVLMKIFSMVFAIGCAIYFVGGA